MFLLPPANLQRKKNKLVLFFTVSPPLNSRVKKKHVLNFFSTIGLIAPIKNIKQNIGENFVQCLFYETSIKILRLISKVALPLLLICRQNSNVDFVKPIL
jgi:hypothetical protein